MSRLKSPPDFPGGQVGSVRPRFINEWECVTTLKKGFTQRPQSIRKDRKELSGKYLFIEHFAYALNSLRLIMVVIQPHNTY
jgi:hypothetical protein